jgi:hypothetical protein
MKYILPDRLKNHKDSGFDGFDTAKKWPDYFKYPLKIIDSDTRIEYWINYQT